MVHFFAFHRKSIQFQTGKARLAPVLFVPDRAHFYADAPMVITTGFLCLEAEGVQRSAFYDLPATGFFWRSKDGMVTCTNPDEITGGALEASGEGVGTTILPIINDDPGITSVYLEDEEL